MNKTSAIVGAVVGIIIIGGGAFYGGMKYGESKTPARGAQVQFVLNGGGAARFNRGGGSGGFVSGQILSKDNTSVTIKLRSGGSQIVFFSGSTEIMKSDAGTAADLSVGQEVMATGSTNSDGSVTAQTIQIRPAAMPTPGARTASSTN